jgi:hypothetical protein
MVKVGVLAALSLWGMYAALCFILLDDPATSQPPVSIHPRTSEAKSQPVANAEYLELNSAPNEFDVEDTDLLISHRMTVPSTPYTFGYPIEEGLKVFPPYEYPPCNATSQSSEGDFIDLNFDTSSINVICRGKARGKYVIGPKLNYNFINPRETDVCFNVSWISWRPKPIEPHYEWAIASCRDTAYKYELHQMKPRHLPEVEASALHTTQALEQEANSTKPPLTIAMLTLDSFSRRHFYRKLPKTIELLNQIEAEGVWKVHDFKLHNIIGTDTAENQSFIFGRSFQGFASRSRMREGDFFGKSAIWSYFREKGFVTLLGFDACAYKMNRVIGRNPRADHVVNPFYCAAEKYSGYSSHKKAGTTQRCLGTHMAHWYLMNYTLNFMDIYPENNHWAYNHLTPAHEVSGQHAQTLDDDLVWYLKELIGRSAERDMVIYVIGDHGMRYGNFLTDSHAIQEHRLPVFFLLNKRSYLGDIEYSYDALAHNTGRLTSKPDIRRSLMFLANNRYDRPLKASPKAIDLYTEKAANGRTCEDIGIPPWYCSTYVLEAVPYAIYNQSIPTSALNQSSVETRNMIETAVAETIFIMNSESYGSFLDVKLCQKLSLRSIELVISHEVPSQGVVIKIVFTIHENLAARFDAWFLLTPTCMTETPTHEFTNYPPFLVYYNSEKYCGKLINTFRTDEYKGECEALAREAEINAEFCICVEEMLSLTSN